jgi:hypothetical protein
MSGPLQFGQIIWAEIADPNGIRKSRPAVILTPTDRIGPSTPIEVVAVTSSLPQPLPEDYVILPWHAQGHPRTGLNRKCAAVCNWLARILPGDIQSVAGFVPGPILAEVVSKVSSISPEPPDAPGNEAQGGKGS